MTTWTVQIVSSGGKSNLKMPLVLIILWMSFLGKEWDTLLKKMQHGTLKK
jgi:hypothetical protein